MFCRIYHRENKPWGICRSLEFTNRGYGWSPSQRFHEQFWAVIKNENGSIGKAHQDSKENNLYCIDLSGTRLCYYELILFGDPSVELTVHCSPCVPGDLDGDGMVTLADPAILLAHYGIQNGATYEQGDIDGDGDVDLTDLADLLGLYENR